ncbi:ATP-binding protein [Streptomyces sp. L7]
MELRYGDDDLAVRIRDNGPGQPATHNSGHGLLGMRERAATVGGTLRTGPAPAADSSWRPASPVNPDEEGPA